MTAKRIFQSLVIVVILVASFASTGAVLAWSGCANNVTVQWGDTLNSIASACGTTVQAIQAANPGLGWWLYPGQVLNIPTGNNPSAPAYNSPVAGSTYVIQWGDTLGDIATKYGVSLSDILAVNPQIWNASLIFPGQVINLPALTSVPPSTNYPSTNNPNTCTPSPYNPSACNPSNYNPPSYYPSNYDPNACNPSPYNPSACNPSNYNPPSYHPSNCNPSPYNHYACNPSTYYPSPANSPLYSELKITSGPGLLVRAGPGMNFIEIRSPFVSAVNDSEWRYRKNSVTIDSTGLVWVEVALSQPVNGYSTGWIMVRDQIGTHFTDPNIDP